jgi:hypothetical protein
MSGLKPDPADAPVVYTRFDELHRFLTREMSLLAEPEHGGSWRTYFFREIVWHPSRTTRTVKVLLDGLGIPFKVQLCVSSDNNNSVFVGGPFERDGLKLAIENEIGLILMWDGGGGG